MTRRTSDSFDEDPNAPDEADWDTGENDIGSADHDDTLPCPFCKAMIYDQSDVCPACGNFVTLGAVPNDRPKWIVATAIVLLIVMSGAIGIFSWLRR